MITFTLFYLLVGVFLAILLCEDVRPSYIESCKDKGSQPWSYRRFVVVCVVVLPLIACAFLIKKLTKFLKKRA
ncbi:TMhelix containing protein [Vibrio phage 1.081.O._10N.286.52.C2]|nr:TMhelix containing protein [Vibrio phage 1.081.O._10N.286.52.C2]